MDKKYLSFASLAAVALLAVSVLAGCTLLPTGESDGASDETLPADSEMLPEESQAQAEASAAPVITDAELDQEIKNIDASLDTVKTTGFEPSSLADKDLGI